MIDPVQLRDVLIRPTLERLVHQFPGADHPAAVNLLIGTAYHESLGGTYFKQAGGPALGLYQIEPATHSDLWNNYLSYRSESCQRLIAGLAAFEIKMASDEGDEGDDDLLDRALITSIDYSTAVCRLLYYRQRFDWPEPEDVPALAEIWKQFYNTELGAGTVEQFIEHFPMEVL